MAVPYEKIVAEDLNLGSGSVSVSMPAGGSATGTRIGIHTLLPQVYNPLDYGCVGDGHVDDTLAFQALITACPTGSTILLPAIGTFKCGNLVVNNKTHFAIESLGASIQWTGTGVGGAYIGIQLTGTLTDCRFDNLVLNGDGVLANAHAGIWNSSGPTLTNIKIRGCRITNVIFGAGLGADGSGSIDGLEMSGNYVDNVVGTSGGSGYGLYHASSSSTPANVRIVNNEVSRAQRHSIYQGKGVGVVIANNTIRLHRTGQSVPGSPLCAIVVARTTDFVVSGNLVDTAQDGGISVEAGEGIASGRGAVVGNTIANGLGVAGGIVIGTSNPSVDGVVDGVDVVGNTIFTTGILSPQVFLFSGLRINIVGNHFTMLAVPGTSAGIYIPGSQETAGTSTYTDYLQVIGNIFYGTNNGGSYRPIEFGTAAAASGIRADFFDNRVIAPGNAFAFDATQTNPNLRVFNMPSSGMDTTLLGALDISPLITKSGAVGAAHDFLSANAGNHNYRVGVDITGGNTYEIIPSTVVGGRVFSHASFGLNQININVGPYTDMSIAGTLAVCDKTPSTGVTRFVVQAGAGQPGAPLLFIRDSAGNELASISEKGIIAQTPIAYASLPGTPSIGMLMSISDSTTAVWGAVVAGGGANGVLARYNGVNWTVVGK